MSTPNTDKSKKNVDVVIHTYDGIQEYDNMMPGWWALIFVITIFWSAIYVIIYYDRDTYQEDLTAGLEEINALRAKADQSGFGKDVSEEKLKGFTDDKAQAAKGKTVYTTNCVACHGANGEGGIGANLTDEYWLHGGDRVSVFNTITKGFVEKGMPGWEASISSTDRAALVAYVYSLAGTNPPNAKAPQGEKFVAPAADAPVAPAKQ
ncbi:MAG TPA: c-type cytochrome [Rhodothermales bacterium]|nr:c-type cytochrome [Rhodothermales bacterium]